MTENLESEKYHTLDADKKKLLVIFSLLLLVVLPVLFYFYVDFAIRRPAQVFDEKTVEIKSGWGVSQIADELYKEDVINSKALFKAYVLFNRLEKNVQAGVYTIPAGTSVKELANILQHGVNDEKVTFLEGWRVEQFALKAADAFDEINYDDFVREGFEDEGYLFPDTYILPKDTSTEDLIEVLKDTFEDKIFPVLTEEALSGVDLDEEEVIILASIVEREVADPYDRPLVAGILVKRYKEDMPLGADATVQYFASLLRAGCDLKTFSLSVCPERELAEEIDWWPYTITQEELDYESDYNTRKYVGLPPHPISSVSISAVNAVLNNKETPYTYYLNEEDGTIHFAETFEEHERNINLYLR